MPQTQLIKYKHPDKSFDINQKTLPAIRQGVYAGFDLIPTSNLTFTLRHTSTGIEIINESNTIAQAPQGFIQGPQGLGILTPDEFSFDISAGPVSNPRIDTIYARVQYVQVIGGTDMSVFYVEGTEDANPTAPALANPLTDVKIGELYWPAGATQIDQATFTKERRPNFGGVLIVGADLESNTITSREIGPGEVGTDELANGSLTAAKFIDRTITRERLVIDCVGSTELGENAVATRNIQDDSISEIMLRANAVSDSRLADMPNDTIKGNFSGSTGDPQNISLANLKTKLKISDADWTTLALATGYTAVGGNTPRYRVVNGIVYIRGQVQKGATGTNEIFQVPAAIQITGQSQFEEILGSAFYITGGGRAFITVSYIQTSSNHRVISGITVASGENIGFDFVYPLDFS